MTIVRATHASSLLRRAWDSPLAITGLNHAIRTAGNALLLLVMATHLTSPQIAVWLAVLSANNINLAADLGTGSLYSRLIAYGAGGASYDDLTKSLRNFGSLATSDAGANWLTIRALMVQYGLVVTVLAAAAFVALSAGGTWLLLPHIRALANHNDGWAAWAVVLVAGACGLLGRPYIVFLMGMDRVALHRRIEICFILLGQGASICVMLLHGDLFSLALAWFVPPVLSVFAHRVMARTLYGVQLGRLAWRAVDYSLLSKLWPQMWKGALSVLIDQVIYNVAALGIVHHSNAVRSSQLLFSLRLLRMCDAIASLPFTAYLPRLSRLRFQGQARAFSNLVERSAFLAFAVFCTFGTVAALWGGYLLAAVGSHVHLLRPTLFVLLLAGYVVGRYGAIHLQLIQLSNHVLSHISSAGTGAFFLAFLTLLHGREPALAYGIALFASRILFLAPFSLWHAFPLLDSRGRRFDLAAAVTCGALLVGLFFLVR